MVEWIQSQNIESLILKAWELSRGTLSAIAILVIGFWLSSKASRLFYMFLLSRKVETSIRSFLKDIFHFTLNVLIILLAISATNLEILPILTVLGGAALGLGMGLQGGLSNFAGGIMIILSKPFKVGDLIEMQGHKGYIERIEIFNTTIKTAQNKVVILPNSPVFNQTVTNYSTKGSIRIDVTVGIEYTSNYKELMQLIRTEIRKDSFFLETFPIVIGIENFEDSSISLTIRAYTKIANYWDAPLYLNQIIKETMDSNGYQIPFPQRDIHIKEEASRKPLS